MKKNIMRIRALLLIGVLLLVGNVQGCDKKTTTSKGVIPFMETYYIGRYSIAVPPEMKEAEGSRSHKLRYAEIYEVMWPDGISPEKAREAEWNKLMAKIEALNPPEGKNKVIIKRLDFSNVGKWSKAVFYYDDDGRPRTATWSFLMDTGSVGVWLITPPVVVEKENVSNKSVRNLDNISKAYRVLDTMKLPKGGWFCLKHGAINLPYSAQEKSYVRFEGHPLDLKIELEMHETYTVENEGLIEKTIDAIATGYASGVKMKKIRSHKRTVADLNGEEEVLRMTEKEKSSLDFVWEYNGKENSGEYPRIVISMESPDGNLDEKE